MDSAVIRYAILRARIRDAIAEHAPRLHLERAVSVAEELVSDEPPPKRPKGRIPDWVDHLVKRRDLTDEELADIVLSTLLQKWLRAEHGMPSPTNIANAIGQKVGGSVKIGYALLQFAFLSGVATLSKKVRQTDKVDLPGETLAVLGDPSECRSGLHPTPGGGVPTVTQKWDRKLPAFKPSRTSPAVRAADAIRRTKWRVNPDMERIVAEKLYQNVPGAFRKSALTRRERWEARKYMTDIHALREAREGRKAGYFAVRFDHRGRLYQVGNALTYTAGSDAARALLEFADAKQVQTEEGRRALARHLIEHHGSRVPMGEELTWIAANRPLIEYAASQPTEHSLCFAGACRAWLAVERGEPIGLPVSIDATTSALQHMALLLRSPRLARLSNLMPGDRQDVYASIAQECGGLPRDAVKKVAMPTFYGQTVKRSMEKLIAVLPDLADRDELWGTATRIREATARIVPEAMQLYLTLREAAGELTRRGEPVRWTTPSGWQGAMDRRKRVLEPDELSFNGRRIFYSLQSATEELSNARQRNAITANLVHSLDAALLHLAVAELPTGMSIATAHDCFATHADDVPAMRGALVAALREMYQHNDQLAAWWAQWGVKVPCPSVGEWDPHFTQGGYAFS
jgi:hypothetical protein